MALATKTIVLVHGLWVTTESWAPFKARYEARGYTVHTPTWAPLEGRTAAELNASPPPELGRLSILDIVGRQAAFIESLPEKPLIVGHSFGGLFAQMLLDRGLGVAGAAINPAPIAGVVHGPTTLTAALPVIARPNGWNRPYVMSRARFGRRYANAAPRDQIDDAYARYVIPTSGRAVHEAAFWTHSGVKPARRTAPLLITAGDADRLITPYMSRAAYHIQKASPARTDYHLFPGRSHLLIAEPGWEEVADYALAWAEGL
jgi:pimeloyl-ACP methyl ester carboxylesterase